MHDPQAQPVLPAGRGRTPIYWWHLLLLAVGSYSLVNYAYNAVLNPAVRVGVDFPAVYLAADMVQRGENPYDPAALNALAASHGWDSQRVTPFVYHPLSALALVPFTVLTPESASTLWIILCQLALWSGVVLTGLALSRGKGEWFAQGGWRPWAVGAVILVANYRPLFTSFQSGRVDAWVFLLVALTFYLVARNKDLWAGLPLGLAIVLKVTPGLLLLYLVASRRWRAVVSALVICALLAGISVPLLGFETNYTFWGGVLPGLLLGPERIPDPALRAFFDQTVEGFESFNVFVGKLAGFKYYNQAPSGLFHGLFNSEYTHTIADSPQVAQLLSSLTMVVVLLSVAWVILRRFRVGDDAPRRARVFDLGFALVVAATPLISSVAWEHHFSPLVLSFGVLLAFALRNGKTVVKWPVIAGAVAYAGLAVGYSPYIYDVWRKGVWVFGLYGRTYAVLLLVVVLVYLTLSEKADPILARVYRALHHPSGQLRWGWIAALLLIPLLLVAFSLRLAFAQGSSLYIDEYTSLLAARNTAQLGVPRTPSGAFYTRGLLFTYVEAAVLALGSFDKVLVRLPSVLLGTGTVLVLFSVGRRMFNATTALLATFWLAFAPAAIIWGGRARMYTLLQFFVLLATYFFYKGVVEVRRDNARHLFVLFFLAALFTQMQAALLLPAFGLAWLLWQNPRDWLRPSVWLDIGLLGIGLLVRLYLHQLMVLPGIPGPVRPRAFIDPLRDLLAGFDTIAPFFASPDRWLVTGLFSVGLVGLVVLLVRRGWVYLRRERSEGTFVFLFLVCVLLEMALLVGGSWRHPRYLFLILPHFFLAAAAVADAGLRALGRWLQRKIPILQTPNVVGLVPVVLMVLFVVVLGTALAPRAIAASKREDTGYDLAFELVREEWRPGDAVATIVPAACLLYLDQCDYLAIELGYEGYLLERDGRKVEGWGYIPLLQSATDLKAALEAHPRLWLVVDTMRLERRFGPEFIAQVWAGMSLEAFQRGVLVFRSGPDVLLPAMHIPSDVDFDGKVRLLGADLEAAQVKPGETLRLALNWEAQVPLAEDYPVFVHVDDADGKTVALGDGPAVGGLYPMYRWRPGERIVDRREVTLPADLAPGRYELHVGLYSLDTGDRLPVPEGGQPDTRQATIAFFWVGERPAVPPPSHELTAGFDGQVCLEGYDLTTASGRVAVTPGEIVELTLHWGACGPMDRDYHTFVHLIGQDGHIAAQGDAPPLQGKYPTSFWQVDDVLLDSYSVQVPDDALPGDYPLHVGLYVLATGDRVPVAGGEDSVQVTTLEVGP